MPGSDLSIRKDSGLSAAGQAADTEDKWVPTGFFSGPLTHVTVPVLSGSNKPRNNFDIMKD